MARVRVGLMVDAQRLHALVARLAGAIAALPHGALRREIEAEAEALDGDLAGFYELVDMATGPGEIAFRAAPSLRLRRLAALVDQARLAHDDGGSAT